MKLYLDNNIVSALAKDDTPAESEALLAILRAFEAKRCELYTSAITLEELKRYKGPGHIEFVYRLVGRVPVVDYEEFSGGFEEGDGCVEVWSGTQPHATWARLCAMGVDQVDAHHVLVAIAASCDVFLTCDRGILRLADQIKKEFKISILKPSGFAIGSLDWHQGQKAQDDDVVDIPHPMRQPTKSRLREPTRD
jgi:predicted nucleic acid-binding protein